MVVGREACGRAAHDARLLLPSTNLQEQNHSDKKYPSRMQACIAMNCRDFEKATSNDSFSLGPGRDKTNNDEINDCLIFNVFISRQLTSPTSVFGPVS